MSGAAGNRAAPLRCGRSIHACSGESGGRRPRVVLGQLDVCVLSTALRPRRCALAPICVTDGEGRHVRVRVEIGGDGLELGKTRIGDGDGPMVTVWVEAMDPQWGLLKVWATHRVR